MAKLSNELFIDRANLVHNNKYLYSKCNYVNPDTKIIITCLIHGEFSQLPYGHLSGRGCKSCATECNYF